MTNQEAIEDIEKNILPVVGGKSLRMAISALQALDSPKPTAESVQNVQDDDLILRKAAIDTVKNMRQVCDTEDINDYYDLLLAAFDVLPSAQPLVIHCTDCKDWHERQSILGFAISELPPAQPEPKWIPVSERLPEYGVAVLTYDGHCFCVEKRIPTIRDDEGETITGDWWVSDDYDEYDSDYYPNLRDGACIAWMPLPEPYRAERRTDEKKNI